jgi:hypothetical protein
MNEKLRVWWVPQYGIEGNPFYIPVSSVEEGKKILDILAAYDAYQLQNRVKPDYTNAGGLEIYNAKTREYEDWYLQTEDDYFDDVDEYISSTDKANEFEEFNRKLFEQIDWKKIEEMTK